MRRPRILLLFAVVVSVLVFPGGPASAATITVNTTDDLPANDGSCTLKEAITAANTNTASGAMPGECGAGQPPPSVDTIAFDIPGFGPHLIFPNAPGLPAITEPVLIDGYTEPGSSENTLAVGNNAVILVGINGSVAGSADGLHIAARGSTVRGLSITGFGSDGVDIEGAGFNVVAGNFIGVDFAGTTAITNSDRGVDVDSGGDATGNLIGGTDPADRNVISGSSEAGVRIGGGTGNRVLGNYIGTDSQGTMDLGNGGSGVLIQGAASNVIGQAGAGNVISGNFDDGVQINDSAANGNVVRGNLIGVDAGGGAALSNGLMGVRIAGAPGNLIGGTGQGEENVISGHVGGGAGILIQDGGSGVTSGNEVLGNLIGTDASGTSAIPNFAGVVVSAFADGNFIGGTAPGSGNLVSGNQDAGLEIESASNAVQGNFIGTDVTGAAALGNGFIGLDVSTINANNNTVGGTAAGAGNVIAANGNAGINLGGTGNVIQGNFIGTNVQASTDLGNGGHGIQALGTGQMIGGVVGGAGNVIAFNAFDGVSVGGTETSINGNRIFANDQLGIDLFPPNGVDTNDPQDPDGGGNNGQNYPVVTGATTGSSSSTISGTLNSLPNTAFRIEFFNSPSCDPSNHGEGTTFLGATTVATNGSGNASFVKTFSMGLPSQSVVTLTATRLDGGAPTDTSEFSKCKRALRLRSAPSPTPSPSPSPTEPP